MGSGASIWWDLLSSGERAALNRRDELPPISDLVVVGGGMVGAAIAWFARRANLGRVTLLEAQCLGAGASGGAAGLLVPDAHNGTDPSYLVDLGRRSLELWRELDQAVPAGVGLVDIDCLGLEPHPAGWSAPANAERLDADRVLELVPGLAKPAAGVLIPHQGWLNPLRALAAIASDLDTVVTGVAATELIEQVEGVKIATTAGPICAGAVVFATAGPPKVSGLTLDVPAGWVRGHILVTAPSEQTMPGSVAPIATRLPDGRLLIGGTEDVDDTDAVDAEIAQALRQWLNAMVPAAAQAETTHTWCCFRPSHPDRLPVVDRAPGHEHIWFTSGHYKTGILMAPATGHALTTWIESGNRPKHVSELSATRLTD
jgi:glycine/D-amino acid oxidase-like deaminating enzyme